MLPYYAFQNFDILINQTTLLLIFLINKIYIFLKNSNEVDSGKF